jgi:hypothetical protein
LVRGDPVFEVPQETWFTQFNERAGRQARVSQAELADIALEEHYLGCPECAERAESLADYVDLLQVAIIEGNFDLEY